MHKLTIPLALACFALPLGAQDKPDAAKIRKAAEAAVASQDWEAAVASFRKLVEADPKDGSAWHMLGYSLHAKGELDAALEIHVKATEFPSVAPVASYNAACVHALRGRNDEAINWLEKAAALGFSRVAHIESDPDMDPLRDDPRFKKILAKMEKTVGEGADLQTFAGNFERQLTRIVLFGGSSSAGGVSIAYGQPNWKDSYEAQIDSPKMEGRRWRFGKDEWTTLDASVGLTIGTTKVPAGVYYLTLERRAGGEIVMAAIDPATVHKHTIDPYLAHLTTGGIEIPLEHAKSDEVADKLTIELQADRGSIGAGKLVVAFGPHRLTAPVQLHVAKARDKAK